MSGNTSEGGSRSPRREGFLSGLCAAIILIALTQGCATTKPPDRVIAAPSGWPVPHDVAAVTSEFGAARGASRHEGVDMSAPAGTAVSVTADGVVSFAGRFGDYGRSVVVDHGDGWQTRYAHLKKIKVNRGDRLKRGATIGTVGRSGNATGSHLHYEVIRNGLPVDPRPYLDR